MNEQRPAGGFRDRREELPSSSPEVEASGSSEREQSSERAATRHRIFQPDRHLGTPVQSSAAPRLAASAPSPRPQEPSQGAARREGVLLVAYLILFVVGVWSVVASELGPQEPASTPKQSVTPATEKSQAVRN